MILSHGVECKIQQMTKQGFKTLLRWKQNNSTIGIKFRAHKRIFTILGTKSSREIGHLPGVHPEGGFECRNPLYLKLKKQHNFFDFMQFVTLCYTVESG